MPHAFLISEQKPMKVQLNTALLQALKGDDPSARSRVTAHKYAQFARLERPEDVDAIVLDVDLQYIREAMLQIKQWNLDVPVLCFYSQESEHIEESLMQVGATAVLMLPPNMMEKSAQPHLTFFKRHIQPVETLAEAA